MTYYILMLRQRLQICGPDQHNNTNSLNLIVASAVVNPGTTRWYYSSHSRAKSTLDVFRQYTICYSRVDTLHGGRSERRSHNINKPSLLRAAPRLSRLSLGPFFGWASVKGATPKREWATETSRQRGSAWSQVCLRARSLQLHARIHIHAHPHIRASPNMRVSKKPLLLQRYRSTSVFLRRSFHRCGTTRSSVSIFTWTFTTISLSRSSLFTPHRIAPHRTVSNSSRNLAASAEAVSPFSSDRNAARSGADKSGVKAFGPSAIFSGSILRRRHLSVRNSIHQSGLDYAALVTGKERERERRGESGACMCTSNVIGVYMWEMECFESVEGAKEARIEVERNWPWSTLRLDAAAAKGTKWARTRPRNKERREERGRERTRERKRGGGGQRAREAERRETLLGFRCWWPDTAPAREAATKKAAEATRRAGGGWRRDAFHLFIFVFYLRGSLAHLSD